jgi:AcrR family transcriptional regulator
MDEEAALVAAAHRVMRRNGFAGATVVDILDEAGLSTRAFYRHFESKDALLLAMYRRDIEAVAARLGRRVAAAGSPRAALEAWLDEVLSLAYDPRRAGRAALFRAVGWADPERASVDALVGPLVEVLRGFPGADPELDARSIHAVVWAIALDRLTDPSAGPTRAAARAHVLRFCLPALLQPGRAPEGQGGPGHHDH